MDVREKLIEILRKPIFPHELVDPTEAVADYLLDSGVTVQEWISVDERLPETQVEVLTYSDCNGVRSACLLASNEETNMWYLCSTDKLSIYVTYWQPMPQPPKGE